MVFHCVTNGFRVQTMYKHMLSDQRDPFFCMAHLSKERSRDGKPKKWEDKGDCVPWVTEEDEISGVV